MNVAVQAMNLPAHLAGVGNYTVSLVQALCKLEIIESIGLWTNRKAAPIMPAFSAKVDVFPVDTPNLLSKIVFSQTRFPELAAKKFDLFHSVGNVGVLSSKRPQVVTVHDLVHRALPQRFGWPKRFYLELGFSLTSIGAAEVICVSKSTEFDLLRFYPRFRGRSHAIHSAGKIPSGLRSDDSKRDGFLFVGTLEPGKNLAFALQALAQLKTRFGIEKKLKIIGAKGWKQTHMPDLIQSLHLGSQVEFCGVVSEVELAQAYGESEALLFPSLYEGFGLPILEAQASGCPVLSLRNSCLPEIGGEGAIFVFNGDINGYSAAMASILQDPEYRLRLQKAGYANVDRFAWEKTARQTADVYALALKRAQSPPQTVNKTF